MQSEAAEKLVRTIVTTKETDDYRIVTDDSDNWNIVANRSFAKGEPLASLDTQP